MAMSRTSSAALFFVALTTVPLSAQADTELSFYGGYQTAPHSVITGNDPEATWTNEFTAGFEGKSFEAPPYYGVRATRWNSNNWGWGAEFTHSKVYADDETRATNGYDRFELTDGLNIFTVNMMRRWPGQWGEKLTPYVGGGVGFAMPHVDIQATGGSHTFGYQLTGPAIRATAGVNYSLSDHWGAFAEYQGTFSAHNIDLDNGGSLETKIITNALNLGVSYSF
jgi:lipid A oxidase